MHQTEIYRRLSTITTNTDQHDMNYPELADTYIYIYIYLRNKTWIRLEEGLNTPSHLCWYQLFQIYGIGDQENGTRKPCKTIVRSFQHV